MSMPSRQGGWKRLLPSRLPKDWRPQVVQPSPAMAAPLARSPASASTAEIVRAVPDAVLSPEEVQAKVEEVLDMLGDRDRKKFRLTGL